MRFRTRGGKILHEAEEVELDASDVILMPIDEVKPKPKSLGPFDVPPETLEEWRKIDPFNVDKETLAHWRKKSDELFRL